MVEINILSMKEFEINTPEYTWKEKITSQLTILHCCNVAATVSLVMVTFYFYVVTTCFCMVGDTSHDVINNVVPQHCYNVVPQHCYNVVLYRSYNIANKRWYNVANKRCHNVFLYGRSYVSRHRQ